MISWDFLAQPSRVYRKCSTKERIFRGRQFSVGKYLVDPRSLRKIARLLPADRKITNNHLL